MEELESKLVVRRGSRMRYRCFAFSVVAVMTLACFAAVISSVTVEAAAPYLINVRDFTDFYAVSPYGKINVITSASKVINDGVTTYDWYYFDVKFQTVPGKYAYASHWQTYRTFNWNIKWFSNPPTEYLVDYDPTGTVSNTVATVTLTSSAGPSGPSGGGSVAWSYSIPDVTCIDKSDFSVNKAAWQHDFAKNKVASKNTFKTEPGFVVKVPQNGKVLYTGYHNVTWWKDDNWIQTYYTTKSGSILEVQRLGDT